MRGTRLNVVAVFGLFASALRHPRRYLHRERYERESREVDEWIERRRIERICEEMIFEEAARRGELQRLAQVELGAKTRNSSSVSRSNEEDPIRRAIRAFVRVAEYTHVSVPPRSAQGLLALREVAFHADSFSAEISHTIDEQLADSNDGERLPARLVSWLTNPVGTGIQGQVSGMDPKTIYPLTAAIRFVGTVLASYCFIRANLGFGVVLLMVSVVTSGFLRFMTNAETAVTLRARYVSYMLGNLGDIVAMLSLTVYLYNIAGPNWAFACVAVTVFMVFGSLMRTAVLSAGVHVSRIRMERVARVGGIAIGATLAATGHPGGIVVTFVLISLWVGVDIIRVIRGLANSTTTHFSWVATSGFEGAFTGGLVSASTMDDEGTGSNPEATT